MKTTGCASTVVLVPVRTFRPSTKLILGTLQNRDEACYFSQVKKRKIQNLRGPQGGIQTEVVKENFSDEHVEGSSSTVNGVPLSSARKQDQTVTRADGNAHNSPMHVHQQDVFSSPTCEAFSDLAECTLPDLYIDLVLNDCMPLRQNDRSFVIVSTVIRTGGWCLLIYYFIGAQ